MSILDHLTLNVSDYGRSKGFYEAALATLGVKVLTEYQGFCGFGIAKPDFWLAGGPSSYQTAEQLSPITPVHLAFAAASREAVDAFYAAAIEAGGVDRGEPGSRGEYHEHYYGAYVLDFDGHNIEAVCHLATPE